MKAKQYLLLGPCTAAVGLCLALNAGAKDQGGDTQRVKLAGSWIAKVPEIPPLLWTYTLSPTPSGKEAALSGAIQVPVKPTVIVPGLFADLEYVSPMIGRIVMTGTDTANFTAVWYGMKTAMPFDQVVFIGVTSGDIKFTAPGKAEVHHNLSFYSPSKDKDGDHLPDPGEAADLCLPATSIDTQLQLLPPCQL